MNFLSWRVTKRCLRRPERRFLPLQLYYRLQLFRSSAAPVAFYTASGVGGMGNVNAETWGGGNFSNFSSAFEVTIDFTATVDNETNPIMLWEAGGSGTGSVVVLDNDQLHYWAGNSTDDVVSATMVCQAQLGVQIVTVFEIDAGTEQTSCCRFTSTARLSLGREHGQRLDRGENGSNSAKSLAHNATTEPDSLPLQRGQLPRDQHHFPHTASPQTAATRITPSPTSLSPSQVRRCWALVAC